MRAINKQCSICSDPAVRTGVDQLLSEGHSRRDIEAKVGRSKSSIDRHAAHSKRAKAAKSAKRSGRLHSLSPDENSVQAGRGAGRPRKTPTDGRCAACGLVSEGVEPQTLLRRTERLLSLAEGIAAQAQADEDSKLALMAVDRASKALDILARATGLIGDGGTTVVIDQRKVEVAAAVATLPTPVLRLVAMDPSDAEMRLAIATIEERRALPAVAGVVTIDAEVVRDNRELSTPTAILESQP
jgi:hypothetical protein